MQSAEMHANPLGYMSARVTYFKGFLPSPQRAAGLQLGHDDNILLVGSDRLRASLWCTALRTTFLLSGLGTSEVALRAVGAAMFAHGSWHRVAGSVDHSDGP